jgi:hypothetical protein
MQGTIECPSRQQVAKWVLHASHFVSHQTMKKAWRKEVFEWYPKDKDKDKDMDMETAQDLKWYKRVWYDKDEEIEILMCAC